MQLNKKEINHLLTSESDLRYYRLWVKEQPEDFFSFKKDVNVFFDQLIAEAKSQYMLILLSIEDIEDFQFLPNKAVYDFLMSFSVSGKNNIKHVSTNEIIKTKDIQFEAINKVAKLCLSEEQKPLWINNFIKNLTTQSIFFLKENEDWWDYYETEKLAYRPKNFWGSKDSFFPHVISQNLKGKKQKTGDLIYKCLKDNKSSWLSVYADDIVFMTNIVMTAPELFSLEDRVFMLKSFLDRFRDLQKNYMVLNEDDFINRYGNKKVHTKRSTALDYIESLKKDLKYGGKKLFWKEAWIELAKQYPKRYRHVVTSERPPIVSMDMFVESNANDLLDDAFMVMTLSELGFKPPSSFAYLSTAKNKKTFILKELSLSLDDDVESWSKSMESLLMFSRVGSFYKLLPLTARSFLSREFGDNFTVRNMKTKSSKITNNNACEILANYVYYADESLDLEEEYRELLKMSFKI